MSRSLPPCRNDAISGMYLLLLYLLCGVVVLIYLNTFPLWAWLYGKIGPGLLMSALPLIALSLVILFLFIRLHRDGGSGTRPNAIIFATGIFVALIGLLLPEQGNPVKQIHVAQYIAFAILVRFVLAHRLSGTRLTFFSALVTLLYGTHDEMLQGLHSLRYYGLRDILVNGTSGISGALLGHGVGMIGNRRDSFRHPLPPNNISPFPRCCFVMQLSAAALLAVGLYHYREAEPPLLLSLPLLLSTLLLFLCAPEVIFISRSHHGWQVVFWLTAFFLLYPLLIRSGGLVFR